MDAAAVVSKNPNVAADISGLLEGRVSLDVLFEEKGDIWSSTDVDGISA